MKKVFNLLWTLALGTLVSGYLSTAFAFTVYTSESDFVAALDSYYLEEFDGFSEGDMPSSLDMGPVNGFGYKVLPTKYRFYGLEGALATENPGYSIQFVLTGSLANAFGGIFWPTDFDLENQVADIRIELQLAGGGKETYTVENAAFDTFIGFTSQEAFTSIIVAPHDETLWNEVAGDNLYLSADHVYAGSGSSVPVPGTVWLLASGLIGLAGLRRK